MGNLGLQSACVPLAPELEIHWPHCNVFPKQFQLWKAFLNTQDSQSTHMLGFCGPQTHMKPTLLSLLECVSPQGHLTAFLLSVGRQLKSTSGTPVASLPCPGSQSPPRFPHPTQLPMAPFQWPGSSVGAETSQVHHKLGGLYKMSRLPAHIAQWDFFLFLLL